MDARMYPIRQGLSAALAHLEDARAMYPDAPVVSALDSLQDAVSRMADLVQELAEQPPRPAAPAPPVANRYVRRRAEGS